MHIAASWSTWCPWGPQILFLKAASHLSSCWCIGLFLPRHRTLHLPLLNFMRFLASSKPLLKMLYRSVDPKDTLLITALQLDFHPFPSPGPGCSASFQSILLLVQLLYEVLMWDNVKNLIVVQVNNIHSSPSIYQTSHFIVEFNLLGVKHYFPWVKWCWWPL